MGAGAPAGGGRARRSLGRRCAAAAHGHEHGEWARYLSEDLGVGLPPETVAALVIVRMVARYIEHLPLMPGAVGAVRRLAARWPLGLASSSPPSLIETVLDAAALRSSFVTAMSTEQVSRGKCLTCLRPEPGVDEQRSAITFDEQAADGHGDLPLLVERVGMAVPVPDGQVREERPEEQPHRPVDCIGELHIIQVHRPDR